MKPATRVGQAKWLHTFRLGRRLSAPVIRMCARYRIAGGRSPLGFSMVRAMPNFTDLRYAIRPLRVGAG